MKEWEEDEVKFLSLLIRIISVSIAAIRKVIKERDNHLEGLLESPLKGDVHWRRKAKSTVSTGLLSYANRWLLHMPTDKIVPDVKKLLATITHDTEFLYQKTSFFGICLGFHLETFCEQEEGACWKTTGIKMCEVRDNLKNHFKSLMMHRWSANWLPEDACKHLEFNGQRTLLAGAINSLSITWLKGHILPGVQLVYKAQSSSGDYHGKRNYEDSPAWSHTKSFPTCRPRGQWLWTLPLSQQGA